MDATHNDQAMAELFEEQRDRLMAVASRMLGSRADAEDAVQEAWLRFARQDEASIDNVGGWLTTVVSRVCIDMLRSRTAKAETSLDDRLDWVVTEDDAHAPERNAVLADSVGAALQIVLDTLRPDERLAFVLHDSFAVPFTEIGEIIGKSTDATKMLASRARARIRLGTPGTATDAADREVIDAFLAAAGRGDLEGLLAVLDPEAELHGVGPQGTFVVHGAEQIARNARVGARQGALVYPAVVDGLPGLLVTIDGQPHTVLAITVTNGVITMIRSLSDPGRLAQLVPSWVA